MPFILLYGTCCDTTFTAADWNQKTSLSYCAGGMQSGCLANSSLHTPDASFILFSPPFRPFELSLLFLLLVPPTRTTSTQMHIVVGGRIPPPDQMRTGNCWQCVCMFAVAVEIVNREFGATI